jgi:hypothetical protein
LEIALQVFDADPIIQARWLLKKWSRLGSGNERFIK